MSYRAVLATRAANDVAKLPVMLRNSLRTELERLCESPATLSRPSVTPPYPPGYQLFEFDKVVSDEVHYFSVLFRYASDEQTLLIHGIGHRRRNTGLDH